MNLEQRAAALFCNELASEATNAFNRDSWVKAVQYLGDKWLIVKPLTFVANKEK